MFKIIKLFFFSILFGPHLYAANEIEVRKTHLEDIFIWKMSDELKLSVKEEKLFTETHRNLNKKKIEINKQIIESSNSLTSKTNESDLKKYRKLIQDYNQINLEEFDSIKKILGNVKFVEYLKIKNELNIKMKSLLIGEKAIDKKEGVSKTLPSPKVIVEKNDN